MSTSWRELARDPAQRHLVQVYRDRGFLTRSVTSWLGDALREGGSAVLACTPRSLQEIRASLGSQVDLARATREGRVVEMDAADVIARCVASDLVDAAAFKAMVHAACERARLGAREGAEVRAWGEVVDVLARTGRSAAAQRLEGLWNEVIDETGIRLLCSYELDHLAPTAHAGPLHDAVLGHTHLFVEEDEEALEAAVDEALVEVYGDREAAHVRATLAPHRVLPVGMATGAAILVALQRADPEKGGRVLAAARRILAGSARRTAA